jgi:hypothetical protein
MIRDRRDRVVNSLLEILTGPDGDGPTTEEIEHFILVAHYFGVTGKIDSILQSFSGTESLVPELSIGIVCHILNRLLRSPKEKT